MLNFAMILSGCGGMDGTEIHEAVCLQLAIRQVGAKYSCFAINKNQKYVIHSYGMEQSSEKRNMLLEAGRLNHGNIHDLTKLNVKHFNALILPGGYGTGTSLSNFIECDGKTCKKNVNYKVVDEIKNVIQEFHNQNKPIFAGCMAPVLVNGSLTGIKIMTDEGMYTKEIIEKHNNEYQICKANDVCVDEKNKIVSVPFYMSQKVEIETIYNESVKAVNEIIKMC